MELQKILQLTIKWEHLFALSILIMVIISLSSVAKMNKDERTFASFALFAGIALSVFVFILAKLKRIVEHIGILICAVLLLLQLSIGLSKPDASAVVAAFTFSPITLALTQPFIREWISSLFAGV